MIPKRGEANDDLHGTDTVRAHYLALVKRAGDCISCGDCEARCPFGVHIAEHMKMAVGIFGE